MKRREERRLVDKDSGITRNGTNNHESVRGITGLGVKMHEVGKQ